MRVLSKEDSLREEHQALAQERLRLEERYHALNGEAAALREEREQLHAEIRRLGEEERKLRAVVDDQTDHLGRTYAEIGRLNGLVRQMEGTRAWRMHQWWQRRTS